tara:strand:+ start:15785 stop:16351 length:567 start_codon:yes stop_codon:yes gene_type:complete
MKKLITYLKRIFFCIIFIITSPIFLLVALICILFQGWPIIFKSERIGKNGVPFIIYKFRTMREGMLDDRERITRVGSILRRSSLDEIPQIINLINGSMELIGARPLPPRCFYSKRMKKYFHERHIYPPGLTGLAQVYGKGKIRSAQEKLVFDIFYIRNKSILLDLFIFLKTFVVLYRRAVNNKKGISL